MSIQNPDQKSLYIVKGWNGKEWKYFGHIYLNPFDNDEKKKETLKELKQNFGKNFNFNVSNFFNVYL